jgi:predicted nucleotidyltransferase
VGDLGLPQEVEHGLRDFVAAAQSALGGDLVSVVLFGSAAEGRLRASSDVNLILVLARFERARIDALREPLRLAHAALNLEAMLILESEIADAAEGFAVKFGDIHDRHRVLHGPDPFAALEPSRAAKLTRLKQILLNFILRMRERYALVSLRDEQLAAVVADAAGPLRAAAAQILLLEGRAAATPKAALETLAARVGTGNWQDALAQLSQAREHGTLPAGAAGPALLALIALAQAMRERVKTLS